MLTETQQCLIELVSSIREFTSGVQYWSGSFPVSVSHCFLKEGENCGGIVEACYIEFWLRFVNFHCKGCDQDFQLMFSDFGLVW